MFSKQAPDAFNLFSKAKHPSLAFLLTLGLLLLPSLNAAAYAQDLEPLQQTGAESYNKKEPISARVEFYANRYLIGPGDILSYKVMHEPDYVQEEVLVRPDGTATFDGVGELYVNNATINEIAEMIHERLSETLVDPQVMLNVVNTRPVIVYMSGAVTRPGMIQFFTNPNDKSLTKDANQITVRTDTRVFNVIANAGGVQMDADLSRVMVKRGKGCQTAIHNDPNACESTVVDLWKLLQEGESENDIRVYSGDSIYVPKMPEMAMSDEQYEVLLRSDIGPKTFPVRVIGEVNAPGVVDLNAQSALLNTALARAGGFAPQANKKVLALRRFSGPNTFTTVFIDASKNDFMLRPNDVLYIGESKLYTSGRFMDQVAKVLSPFNSAGVAAMGSAQILGIGGFKRP
ncbi:MAG: polysaccharide biosynthesis/export family protein [Vampirovibrionales bacterium]|nr:polysaccharide biosynthesis/export family protein [Vampirovibrionales bacterium]